MKSPAQDITLMSIVKYGVEPSVTALLHQEYKSQGYLYLKNFFDPFLAEHFQKYFSPENLADFFKAQAGRDYVAIEYKSHPDFIKEYNYLINQKNYIEFLEAVTGSGPIGQMKGHAYVSDANEKRGYGFHDDNDGNRYFLVSINITPQKYDGGVFTMRNSKTREVLFQVHNSGSYGALIAPIADNLEHAVSDVTGDVTRFSLLSWAMKLPQARRFKMFD